VSGIVAGWKDNGNFRRSNKPRTCGDNDEAFVQEVISRIRNRRRDGNMFGEFRVVCLVVQYDSYHHPAGESGDRNL